MGSPDSVEQANPYSLSWLRVRDGVAWVRHRWVFFLLVAFTLFVISAFTPYLVSTFYLELGGRKLDQVLDLKSQFPMPNIQILHPNSPFSLSNPPLASPDSGHLSVAIAHLRQAIYWDGNNAQAYRLLGQAYLAQGDHLAAIEALTAYTDLRPDNPLGHLELAQVYDGLARASEPEEVYYDFIEHLPEAAVTTPGDPIQTDYCLPNGPLASCYVASTHWTMPDDKLRPVLFMHPSSWARYAVTVSAEAPVLRFSVGMYPPSRDWGGDGALFEVCVQNGAEEKRLFSTYVSNNEEDWGWHDGEVDLTPYVGQVVTLTLGAHPGLQGDSTGDWAGWAEPRLERRGTLQRRVEAEEWWAKAVAEWQAAGLTAQDFIELGEKAHKAKQYEEALGWYERAVIYTPENRSAWRGLAIANALAENPRESTKAWLAGGYRARELLTWADSYRRQRLWKQAWLLYRLANQLHRLEGPDPFYSQAEAVWTEVINSEFEIDSGQDFGLGDLVPGNGIPDGWTVFSHQGGYDSEWVEFSLLSETKGDLARSLQVVPKRSGLDLVIASNPLIVDANTYFVANCQAMRLTYSMRARIEVQFRDITYHSLGFKVSDEIQPVAEWDQLTVSGVTPKDTAWLIVRLRIFKVGDSGTPVQFRTVQVETSMVGQDGG